MRAPAATALADTVPQRLDALLGRACARFADRVALDDGEDVLDYRTLGERGRALAGALTQAGHRLGEPVIVAVDNRCGDLACELGAWAAGAVVVPVHRDSPALVLRSTAERVGARLVLGDPRHHPVAWEDATGPAGHPWIGQIVPGTGTGTRGGGLPRVPAELDADQALVVFTSGSTGRPKGVVLSHRVLHTKLRAISSTLPFGEGHSALHLLHLNFSFGQWTSLLTLATGGTLLLTPRFRAREVLDRLAERPVERTAVVPSMLRLIRRELDGSPDAAALLRRLAEVGSPGTWICGGEPLPAGLGRGIRALLPHAQIADVFGLSESATSDFILTPDRYDEEAGTIGRPSPGVEYRIVPADGAAGTGPDAATAGAAGTDTGAGGTAPAPGMAALGVAGELWLRTNHLMTGYLDDAAATAATMAGPWLRTGDLARHRPQDGLVELVGRAKQLIVRGGAKISPLEVEDAYADHPDCAASVAVGVPDALLGERLHLLFVPRAGRAPTEEELRAHGLRRLELHKVPERVHLIEEPPLGRTGKTDRAAAARIAAARASAALPASDGAPRGAA
ncbi:class I adenylate-forming enzyme family protein [Streptomyces sp. NPDC046759]|uniref:class I adenylate-forming enzyme family protein n=1 Tax=Streptomyces sp. NPDC046759 TaxID=3155019 RepID=UPI0033F37C21